MAQDFSALYCRDHLLPVNPYGQVGVVTLWSKKEFVYERFKEAGVDLDPESSAVAVFGNLYGNGLKFLLANLLYNPQISCLLICGLDRSGSRTALGNFFEFGVQETQSLGARRNMIKGTSKTLDECLFPGRFSVPPRIVELGDVQDAAFPERVRSFFDTLNLAALSVAAERIKVDLPEITVKYFPSNPGATTVVKETPLEAWKELIFRLNRFGHQVLLSEKKGSRIELQNVKVIVEKPEEEPSDALQRYGFSLDGFRQYQAYLTSGDIRGDEDYNYGNRLRAYFGLDCVGLFVKRLRENLQDRRCFTSLWDTRTDPVADRSTPCMASLYARVFDDKLTLTAVFRVHNAVDAWLQNLYGLIAVQRLIAGEVGVLPGSITIISHSISINPSDYQRIENLLDEKRKSFSFESDPNGQFRFAVEDGLITVRHIHEGEVIGEYRSAKAERIQYELKRDQAVSDIGHAIYVGRQLARAERCLETGEEFLEDS